MHCVDAQLLQVHWLPNRWRTERKILHCDLAYFSGFLEAEICKRNLRRWRIRCNRLLVGDGSPMPEELKRYLAGQVRDVRLESAELARARVVEPTLTFDREIRFYLGQREVRVLFLGKGNTEGDAVVVVPDARVVATGDLLVAPVPYGYGCHPAAWIQTLAALSALDAAAIVPGHGPVQRDWGYAKKVSGLLQEIEKQVAAQVKQGATLEQTQERVQLAPFRKAFAGDSFERGAAFDDFFVRSAVDRAYQEATGALAESRGLLSPRGGRRGGGSRVPGPRRDGPTAEAPAGSCPCGAGVGGRARVELVLLVGGQLREDLVVNRLGVGLHLRAGRIHGQGVRAEDGLLGAAGEVGFHLLVRGLEGFAVGLKGDLRGGQPVLDGGELVARQVERQQALLHVVEGEAGVRMGAGRALVRAGRGGRRERDEGEEPDDGGGFHGIQVSFCFCFEAPTPSERAPRPGVTLEKGPPKNFRPPGASTSTGAPSRGRGRRGTVKSSCRTCGSRCAGCAGRRASPRRRC